MAAYYPLQNLRVKNNWNMLPPTAFEAMLAPATNETNYILSCPVPQYLGLETRLKWSEGL